MRLRILWNYPALTVFYDLRPYEAMAVDRAVIRFAELGEGRPTRAGAYHRLRVGAHDVMLAIDRRTWTVTVLRIYRRV